jgi:hypothetical protein
MIKKILDYYRYKKIQTFTYFIPAPPARKTGYREKAFDQLVEELGKLGFKILDLKASPINNSEASGMWVSLTMRSTNKASYNAKPVDFPDEMKIGPDHSPIETDQLVEDIELKTDLNEEFGEVYQID